MCSSDLDAQEAPQITIAITITITITITKTITFNNNNNLTMIFNSSAVAAPDAQVGGAQEARVVLARQPHRLDRHVRHPWVA